MSVVTKGRHRIVAKRQNSVAFLNLLAQAGLLSLKEVILYKFFLDEHIFL